MTEKTYNIQVSDPAQICMWSAEVVGVDALVAALSENDAPSEIIRRAQHGIAPTTWTQVLYGVEVTGFFQETATVVHVN